MAHIRFTFKHCNSRFFFNSLELEESGDERVQSQGIMGWQWKHPGLLRLKENCVKSNPSLSEEIRNEVKRPLGQPDPTASLEV